MSAITGLPDLAPTLGVEMKVVEVTPTLAAEWLEHNTINRGKKERKQTQYAADMTAGRWLLDGSPIRFAADGRLLDGQNRLMAIIKAGTPVRSVVVAGVTDAAQHVMDTGAPRTLNDDLRMSGETNSVGCAAVTGFLVRRERGSRGGVKEQSIGRADDPSRLEMLDYYWGHRDEIQHAVKIGRRTYDGLPRKSVGAGVISGLFVLFNRINEEDAEQFYQLLRDDPANLPGAGHPVAALRRALEDQSSPVRRRPEKYIVAMTIKSWNAYREGREVKTLSYRPGGARPERFPEPV